MRIAFFHNLPPGGAQRVLYNEIKGLNEKNIVDLYCYKSTDDSFLNINKIVNNYFLFNFPQVKYRISFLTRLLNDLLVFVYLPILSWFIAYKIDQKKYDVVIVHPDSFTQAPYIIKYLKTPCIYYCHELLRICYEPELEFKEKVNIVKKLYEKLTRFIRKNIDSSNAKLADLILTNSKYIGNKVEKEYARKSIVCYPGVDFDFFKNEKSVNKKYFLFLGDEIYINGWDRFLKIKEKLINNGFLSNNFKVIKFRKGSKVSDKKLLNIYQKSICVFCLSRSEPFGMVGLEALASGSNVMAVNEGGYLENIGKVSKEMLISDSIDNFVLPSFSNFKLSKIEERKLHYFSWDNHNKILTKSILKIVQK